LHRAHRGTSLADFGSFSSLSVAGFLIGIHQRDILIFSSYTYPAVPSLVARGGAHRALNSGPRIVGRPWKYNTPPRGNTGGVLTEFARDQPPGSSRAANSGTLIVMRQTAFRVGLSNYFWRPIVKNCSVAATLIVGVTALTACSVHGTESDMNETAANLALQANEQLSESAPRPAPALSLPAGVLSNAAILPYLRARFTYAPEDEFSPPFDDQPLRGRRFKAVFLESSDLSKVSYHYDSSSGILLLTVADFDFIDYDGKQFSYLPLEQKETEGPSSIGVNAFGITKNITNERVNFLAIGHRYKYPALGSEILQKRLKMSSDEARQAVKDLSLEYEGEFEQGRRGAIMTCVSTHHEPNLRTPRDITTEGCIAFVIMRKISVTSPAGGVLATWGS